MPWKAYRFYLCSGKATLAAIYLPRVRVAGHRFAAALTHLRTANTPPAEAAQNRSKVRRKRSRDNVFAEIHKYRSEVATRLSAAFQALTGFILLAFRQVLPASPRTRTLKRPYQRYLIMLPRPLPAAPRSAKHQRINHRKGPFWG